MAQFSVTWSPFTRFIIALGKFKVVASPV